MHAERNGLDLWKLQSKLCKYWHLQDEDRSAYVVYSSDGNKDLHVGRLSRDYTDVIGAYKTAIAGASREAPALFRHGKRYYMVTSGCTGWDPNKALVHSAQ